MRVESIQPWVVVRYCWRNLKQKRKLVAIDNRTLSSYYNTMKKVIVVGGGVAGLTAAKRLVNSGKFEVKLLEGESRVGGRVETKPFGDHFIENGAQWVHGEKDNVIFGLANSMQLLETKEDEGSAKEGMIEESMFVTNTGRIFGKEEKHRFSHAITEILEGPEENDKEGSVGEWGEKTFKKYVAENSDCLNAATLDWIHRLQNNIDGADSWFQSSLKGQHEYWECEGNPTVAWRAPACYASLFSVIVNDTPTLAPTFQPELPVWIETGKEVNKIEIQQENGGVSVQCTDGSKYTCDHVICTVSLGVLKHSHKSLFQPPLPEKKVKAIEHIGIGCVDKFHFDFKKSWWSKNDYGFSLLWEDVDSVEDYWRSDIDNATLLKEVNGFPLWTRNILGFYQVASHPTALNSWISGPAARLVEDLPDDEVKDTFIRVLRHFLRKVYEVPDPVEFCRSKWAANKFTQGSYSFRQMASEINDVWQVDLADPVLNKSNDPVICFAGEATHVHYYSTVHGAYESGLREADRLINLK